MANEQTNEFNVPKAIEYRGTGLATSVGANTTHNGQLFPRGVTGVRFVPRLVGDVYCCSEGTAGAPIRQATGKTPAEAFAALWEKLQ